MAVKWMPGLLEFSRLLKNSPKLLEEAKHSPMAKYTFELIDRLYQVFALPGIRRIHPWTKAEKNRVYAIPVFKSLERGNDVVLPYQIVEKFIEKSSYRVIMEFCGCRTSYRCKDYPQELGCLMMGEGSRRIKTPWVRPVSKAAARAHLKKAVEANLVPLVGKARVDNALFGVPDEGDLFTVCFCCECCCISRIFRHLPPEERNQQFRRLEGLEIQVDAEKCKGCGTCAEHCFLKLIKITDGKSFIPDDCRGCGRCARACPNGAIKMTLKNPRFLEQAISSIEEKVRIN
ncbi:MAG: 4Fe-4S binding protein [Proteobacteria bacterium]|nr:4Fe-4S binding protein [Pseudomonadota bacterium]